MNRVNYKPTEFEVSELKLRVKEFPIGQQVEDYEINCNFESNEKAFVTIGGVQLRFEKERGRWTCTRGPWD